MLYRRILFAALVLFAAASSSLADYVSEVLSDNPVAYWRLNEANVDSPIVDRTGHIANGEWDDRGGLDFGFEGAIVGDPNKSVFFAQPSNFSCGACGRGVIPVGGVLDLGTADSAKVITMEAWFKILPSVDEGLPITAFPRIFHYNNFEAGQYAFGLVGNNNGGFPSSRSLWAGRGDGTDSGIVILAAETDAIEPTDEEVWHYFVAQLQGDEVRLFLDGDELTDLTDSDPIFWQATQATIGARLQGDGNTLAQPFPGLIDELAIYGKLLSPERIKAHYQAGLGNLTLPGDYNGNGQLDAGDLDLQAAAITGGQNPKAFDLNNDNVVNFGDREMWLHDLKKTWVGDANLDLLFDSNDFVQVFVAGKYETGDTAGWEAGDWDGNQVFDSGDFVAAFVDGGYEIGQRPTAAVSAVPEPTAAWLLVSGLLGLFGLRRSKGGPR